jgi:hypothetical protein
MNFTSLLKRVGPAAAAPAAGGDGDAAAGGGTKAAVRPAGGFSETLFGSDPLPVPQTDLKTSADLKYEIVDTPEKLADLVKQLKQHKRFAFDTETDALGAMNSGLVGMSFSWAAETGWYVPVAGPAGSTFLPATRRWPPSSRCWRTSRSRRSGTTSSTTCS